MRYDPEGKLNTTDFLESAYADAAKSPTNSFIQITTPEASVSAGQTARFKVRATQSIKTVTMQVMTRGYMVLSQDVALKGEETELSFPTTNEMAPKSRIVVYAVRPDNKEILVDAMDFRVEGLFKNNVWLPPRTFQTQNLLYKRKTKQ